MHDLKPKITEYFIELLNFDSWSLETLRKACVEAGLEAGQTEIIYPGKMDEFTNDFVKQCNIEAVTAAWEHTDKNGKIRDKIEELIFQRIKTYHLRLKTSEALKKFAAYSANPVNLGNSIKNIYEFSSDSWYEIGDKSTDFSYYTKRLSLSAIYSQCMLYSLTDKSENLDSTRKFIKKSIDGLMKINKLKQKVKEYTSIIPSPFKGNLKAKR